LSRIWDALKQAERQRARAGDRGAGRATRSEEDQSDDRRKGFRHPHSVPLLVYGSDVDKQPFHEETQTIDVNEDGCLLAVETVVANGQRLFLINMRNQAEQECRVVRVGRRMRGQTRIGVEFLRPAPHFWRAS
jgi:hypothetical protein